MKRTRSRLSSVVASALVFGSLGISGFVGSVASMADDRGVNVRQNREKAVRVENAIDTSGRGQAGRAIPVANGARSTKSQLLGAYLSRAGMLTGRLNVSDSISGAHVSAENLSVKFVRRGSIVALAKPGPGGIFQVDGLTPGVYSLIASGADGFFASTVVVYAFEQDADVEAGKAVNDPLQIDATVVHPSNIAMVNKLIQKGWTARGTKSSPQKKQVVQASRRQEADTDEMPAPIQTPVLTVGSDGRVAIAVDEIDAATGERTPAKTATAYFVQRGAVRGQFTIDQDGSFNAKDLKAGQYSLLVLTQQQSGVPNIAAMGVIVEIDNGNSGTVSTSSRLAVQQVSAKKQPAAPTITPAPGGDVGSTQDPGTGDDNRMAGGAPFGGGGGGGGFGGGMGGGFGGLGLLAGLAGLGAGIGALASENNNNTPASPNSP